MGVGPSISSVSTSDQLKPLSSDEYRAYNRLAVRMEGFHERFRNSWKTLYDACVSDQAPHMVSHEQLIVSGLAFIENIEGHHRIEETFIFPVLARRMPEFKTNHRSDDDASLTQQHKEIHAGMESMKFYLEECKSGQSSLSLSKLRLLMDCWYSVLFKHLDQEVEKLGADNMRQYWSLEEMKRMPF